MSSVIPQLIRTCQRCSILTREHSRAATVTLSCIPNNSINWRLEAEELEAKHDYRQARERSLMGLPLLPSSSRPALHVAVLQHFEVRDAINHWRWAPIVNIRFGKTKVTLSYRHSH